MVSVIEALQPIANMVVYRFRERELIVSQHQRLYEAVRARDPDAAETVFVEQMSYLGEKYAEAQEWRRRRDET
jgi:DNA-binding FadR family transcriptional regulator